MSLGKQALGIVGILDESTNLQLRDGAAETTCVGEDQSAQALCADVNTTLRNCLRSDVTLRSAEESSSAGGGLHGRPLLYAAEYEVELMIPPSNDVLEAVGMLEREYGMAVEAI